MKVFVTRTDLILLDVRKEPTEEARSYTYWWDRCREVPDELVARYEALHAELEQVSVDIEKAYEGKARKRVRKIYGIKGAASTPATSLWPLSTAPALVSSGVRTLVGLLRGMISQWI